MSQGKAGLAADMTQLETAIRNRYPETGLIRLVCYCRADPDARPEWTLTAYSVPTVPTQLLRHVAVFHGDSPDSLLSQIPRA